MDQRNNRKLKIAFGALLVLVALIFVVAFFFGDRIPGLGKIWSVVGYMLGSCAILVPVVLMIAATSIFADENYFFFSGRNFGMFFILVGLCALYHHLRVPIHEELFPERLLQGGGLLGGLVVYVLHRVFDNTSTFVTLLLMLGLGILFIVPFGDVWQVLAWPFLWLYDRFLGDGEDEDDWEEQESGQQEAELPQKEISGRKQSVGQSMERLETMEQADGKEEVRRATRQFPKVTWSDGNEKGKSPVMTVEQSQPVAAVQPKQPDKAISSVRKLYEREEFKNFTDGIRKQSTFKRILTGNSQGVYNDPNVRKDLEQDPIDIPDWQEEGVRTGDSGTERYRYDVNDGTPREPLPSERALKPGESRNLFGASMFGSGSMSGAKRSSQENSKIINMPGLREEPAEEPDANFTMDFQPEETLPKQEVVINHYRSGDADDVIPDTDSVMDLLQSKKKAVPRKRQTGYKFPKPDLLNKPRHISYAAYEKDIHEQCGILEQTLADFKVRAQVIGVTRGPCVTRFEVQPAPGVKVSSITGLADDIALKLAAGGVRIEAPIPGKAAIGIEVPNIQNDPVYLREVVEDPAVKGQESKLSVGLGKDISGNIITADLAKMPHLLVAGSTGSGKSVCINTIIMSLLYRATPDDVKMILVDPKVVELSNYNGIPHLLTPVVTDMKKAASALHWAVVEMERRYTLFAENHAREINAYNQNAEEKLPYIVIIIDELSDLMMVARVDVEDAILRLAQKARAAGIHLILATQRPSVDVITGIVKANIPSRIAFAVSSQTDSRTILDIGGAEKLIGKGDMLYYPIGMNKPVRVQGAFVSDDELARVVEFVTKQSLPVTYSEEIVNQILSVDKPKEQESENGIVEDDLFLDALQLVTDVGQASSSMLQRRFSIGYTRAARLVDAMEKLGIVGEANGSKPREVIMSRQEIEEKYFQR